MVLGRHSWDSLVAFDVSDSTAPKFMSGISVGGERSWQGTGREFAADRLVYLSHREFWMIRLTGFKAARETLNP